MDLIQESFQRLFPDREFTCQTEMEYNRRLSNFNANIKLYQNTIFVNLNLQWKDIDAEIKIGLIQHLLLKLFKQKKNTLNIELYNNFIKNIPILTPKTKTDPILEESYRRVNAQFFYNSLEKPNLEWGQKAYRKLASYNFHDDTVTVSNIFNDADRKIDAEMIDYLMYHELLHKFHKFKHKNGRSSFHTKTFKEDEAKYPNCQEIERKIEGFIRSKKSRKKLWDYFR